MSHLALGHPLRSIIRSLRRKIGLKRTKMGLFWDVVFYENTSNKSVQVYRSEIVLAPTILQIAQHVGASLNVLYNTGQKVWVITAFYSEPILFCQHCKQNLPVPVVIFSTAVAYLLKTVTKSEKNFFPCSYTLDLMSNSF